MSITIILDGMDGYLFIQKINELVETNQKILLLPTIITNNNNSTDSTEHTNQQFITIFDGIQQKNLFTEIKNI